LDRIFSLRITGNCIINRTEIEEREVLSNMLTDVAKELIASTVEDDMKHGGDIFDGNGEAVGEWRFGDQYSELPYSTIGDESSPYSP
jgi:hypothetical protein